MSGADGPTGAQASWPGPGPAAGCEAVEADLVELALGVLTGKERVAALAHLGTCARCAFEVEQLSGLGDQLLALAPAAEPPVGFEAGVFERLGLEGGGRPGPESVALAGEHRRGRSGPGRARAGALVLAAGVAAALLLGAGAWAGRAMGGDGRATSVSLGARLGTPGAPMEVAALDAGGRQVGTVMVYPGNPTWLFMDVYDKAWTGALQCEVTVDQGRRVSLGHFWLAGGRGAWAASTSQPAGRLTEALVVGAHDRVLARAHLS